MSDVGARIRRLRTERRRSRRWLAERCGLSSPYAVANWELGINDPTFRNLRLVAAALEVGLVDLLEDRA